MDKEKEVVSFLQSDFVQSFEQMRYYDNQILQIVKFIAVIYTTLIGLSIGILQYGLDKKINFLTPVLVSLSICLCFGLFFLMLCVRYRVYFVHVTRYLNEIRKSFLEAKPLGIRNISRMFVDESQPPFFNYTSSQIFFIYIVSLANAILLSVLFYVWIHEYVFIAGLVSFILQVSWSSFYLKSHENKSAAKNVFRKENIKL